MSKKLSAKKVFKSSLIFTLVFMITFSSFLSIPVYAKSDVFSGVENAKAEENQTFDLLENVFAEGSNGKQLTVKVKNVSCSTDIIYKGDNVIKIGPAGTVYNVEYEAADGSEIYTAHREIKSIPANAVIDDEKAEQDSIKEESGAESEPQNPDQSADSEAQGGENSSDTIPSESENQGESSNTEAQNPEMPLDGVQNSPDKTEERIPIIFENGIHYIDDEESGKRIILYCMNNELAWPHPTGENPNVPDYTEGYLTPDDFDSIEDYNSCMQKLRKILFAGYPYNKERLYEIIDEEKLHIPSEQEFNYMLIVPPQLKADFPYLAHHEFTLENIKNQKHFNILLNFMHNVSKLYPDKETAGGLHHADITSMPFFKAANSLTFQGNTVTKEDILNTFANLYSSSYFVTDTQACNATQLAVWRLMNEYKIEKNNITSLENNELAKVLWIYCQHGALPDREPDENELTLEGDSKFTFNPEDNMYYSGELSISEPDEYNGLYRFKLPEEMSAICDGLTYVYGNEPYELIAKKPPAVNDKFSIDADIDWLSEMKQYSPIENLDFQHMVGAIVKTTNISKNFYYNTSKEGSLCISKKVTGSLKNPDEEFKFKMEIMPKINGKYGDFKFTDGTAEFTLKNGETKTALHIPSGSKYKITEIDLKGYTVDSPVKEGTVDEYSKIDVVFNNIRLNDLTLSKQVSGEMANMKKLFTFVIEIKKPDGTPLEGTYKYTGSVKAGLENESTAPKDGELTFTKGISEISLSHGQQITIKDIPADYNFAVTEKEKDGYIVSYSQQKGSLIDDAEVHVINEKNYVPDTGLDDISNIRTLSMISPAALGLMLPVLSYKHKKKRESGNDR